MSLMSSLTMKYERGCLRRKSGLQRRVENYLESQSRVASHQVCCCFFLGGGISFLYVVCQSKVRIVKERNFANNLNHHSVKDLFFTNLL